MTPYADADLERDLRAAIDANDAPRIETLGRLVDERDTHAPVAPLVSSALWYAQQGLRVFPLQPGEKIPFKGSRGCKDGTTDPDQIRAWWERTPEANIGIATGHLVDVVDVDGLPGQTSRARMWTPTFATIEADSIGKVSTPRPGGMHIYVPAVPGMGNGAKIAPGIDYRGNGGYVVAPPSRTEVGTYRWLGAPRLVEATGAAA